MTTPSDPRPGDQPMDQQAPRGTGAPGGYGQQPGYGQPADGNAGWPAQQVSQGSPGGYQPAYPPPAGYDSPQGYEPQGYGQQQGYGSPQGYGAPPQGYNQQQGYHQPQGYPQPQGYAPPPGYGAAPGHNPYGQQQASAQKPVPAGAPGPIPEWWERLLGRFLDNLLFVVVSTVLSSIVGAAFIPTTAEILTNGFQLGYSYYLAMAVVYVITGLLFAGYDVAMHSRNGQTLGKMALKTRVVTPSGGAPDQASLIKRAILYPASGFLLGAVFMLIPGVALSGLSMLISVVYAVGLCVPILTDALGRGLHDKWSNTIVVKATGSTGGPAAR